MPITITLPAVEQFDESTNLFSNEPAMVLEMEHSLVSLSKWEQKFKKPFFGKATKTSDEVYAYLQMMCLDPNVPMSAIHRIDNAGVKRINEYIDDPQTATWFNERNTNRPSREIVTNELIYHWITAMTVSMEVQYWHLNRLFTLLKVINEKNAPPKKQSRSAIAARHREINAQNKAAMSTRG